MSRGRLLTGRLGRRAAAFSIAAILIGAPAATLRLLCAGGSCETTAEASPDTPFCSLPGDIRRSVTEAVRDGRSGELLAVTTRPSIAGATAFAGSSTQPRWPSLNPVDTRVPLVLAGPGIVPGSTLDAGVGLDDVAPTISEVLGFDRAHPEVRSGRSVEEVLTPAAAPPLVLMVAWKGVGSRDLEADPDSWPHLAKLIAAGAGTLEATNNSWSADPAAPLTTLGTGGVPSQHGITGSLLRNEVGDLVDAWGPGSPVHVIATLAEDLDEAMAQDPVIALVGDERVDKGLVGGDWFLDSDTDLVSMLSPGASAAQITDEAEQLLRLTPLARDDVPDVLAIAQRGPIARLDRQLARILTLARQVVGRDVLVAVAGTGAASSINADVADHSDLLRRLERAVPGNTDVVEAVGPGEVFLDQGLLAKRGITEDAVLKAVLRARLAGEPVFADVFPSVTVTFGRFC